jgi:tetratricopeptide (TPR) repeat protein
MSQAPAETAHPSVEPLLKQALAHLNANELPQAEGLISRVLTLAPDDAEALQLLGLVRAAQGFFPEAIELYSRSLSLKPDQPHVHANLGGVLMRLSRFDEAVAALGEAVRLKPNFAKAHLNLALALAAAGDHAAAEKSCRNALRLQPNFLLARQTLAAELNALKRPKEAESVARSALAMGSRDVRQVAALEHNLGVSRKMQNDYAGALRLFDAARAKVPDMPLVDYNRGNTLQELGRLEEAVHAYQLAIARNPLDLLAHKDLNGLLYRLGDDDNFLRSYDDAAALYPEIGELPLEKANFLFLKGEYEKAREQFSRAAYLAPESVTPHDGLGLILARQGEFAHAVREHEIAVRMEPENAHAWRNFAETHLRAGDPGAALKALDRSLFIDAQNQFTLAFRGLALRLLGDAEEEVLNDYENFVRVYDIAPPEGFADTQSFNAALNAELDRLHVDKRESIEQTLRKGSQTHDDLFGKGHALSELLRARIDEAVADYIARMKEAPQHPLLARKTAGFVYSASWSARLFDCGYHTNHVHPKGWISSAYYVGLPDAVEKPGAKEGWIKFGEPNFDCGLKDAIRLTVQPRVGTLVLFPSYMWHGTIAFSSSQSRTTIAFDVVPKA